MLKIKKGDLVQVMSGADSGSKKQGHVIAVDVDRSRVRVEGVRMQKHHLKPGRRGAQQGGVVEQEGFIHISNVMVVNPDDGQPSRVRVEQRDGEKVRVFARNGEPIPDPKA